MSTAQALDDAISQACRAGVPMHDIAAASKLYPNEIGDRVRALGLPDRHPTTREIEQPEYPLPAEPMPHPKLAVIAGLRVHAARGSA